MRTLTMDEVQMISGAQGLTVRIDGCYTAQQWKDVIDQVHHESLNYGLTLGGLAGVLVGVGIWRFNKSAAAIAGPAIGVIGSAVAYVYASKTSKLWPWN